MTAIPASAADITAEWLTSVLDVGTVSAVRGENLGAGLGLLGEVTRLRLWDTCWREYRYAVAQQAWSTCPLGDLEPGNERGQLLLDTITPRYLVAADDLGVYEVLDLF